MKGLTPTRRQRRFVHATEIFAGPKSSYAEVEDDTGQANFYSAPTHLVFPSEIKKMLLCDPYFFIRRVVLPVFFCLILNTDVFGLTLAEPRLLTMHSFPHLMAITGRDSFVKLYEGQSWLPAKQCYHKPHTI